MKKIICAGSVLVNILFAAGLVLFIVKFKSPQKSKAFAVSAKGCNIAVLTPASHPSLDQIQDGFIKGNVLGTIILIWIVFRISKSLKK